MATDPGDELDVPRADVPTGLAWLGVAPATAARQLRRMISSMDEHPVLAKWGRDLLTCFIAQMLIDDMSPEAKKVFKQFGIEIPDRPADG